MKIKLQDTSRTRRHNIAGMVVDLIGRRSGTIYFLVVLSNSAIYFSADEEALIKHSEQTNFNDLKIFSPEDLRVISKAIVKF